MLSLTWLSYNDSYIVIISLRRGNCDWFVEHMLASNTVFLHLKDENCM